MKIDTKLDKRLASYSLAAGIALSVVNPATAATWGVDVDENAEGDLTNGESLNIDFLGDGTIEYRISVGGSDSMEYIKFYDMEGSNSMIGDPSAGHPLWVDARVEDLNSGHVVSSGAANLVQIDTGLGYGYIVQGSYGSFTFGSGFTGGQNYIGVRFDELGAKYGWIRVQVFSTQHIKVYDYAFETTGASITCDGSFTLPVELSSFTAVCEKDAVELAWATESEKDNVGFILERRIAGNLDWNKIVSHVTDERLRGHGTTSEKHSYSFTDANVNSGGTYEYRLSDVDINGTVEIKKTVAVTVEATPSNFTLQQNYPNPFNPSTTIEFALTETENVNLSIYNMAGQLVETLVDVELNAGNHSTEWNAANVPAGTYFYQLQAGSHKELKKAVLLK